jgi:Domain of unknown function (DUF397)
VSAGGDCAEVAVGREHVYLRHSEQIGGPVLAFPYREWEAFVAGVLDGEFILRRRRPINSRRPTSGPTPAIWVLSQFVSHSPPSAAVFSWPRCAVVSQLSAASNTVLVSYFSRASGPVSHNGGKVRCLLNVAGERSSRPPSRAGPRPHPHG